MKINKIHHNAIFIVVNKLVQIPIIHQVGLDIETLVILVEGIELVFTPAITC